jgi:hypothetical protein
MGGLVLHKSSYASTSEADAVVVDPPAAASRTRDMVTADRPVVVFPARYVLLPLATALTGYSVKAMERKIERGDWLEGKLWKRAPDGRIMIDLTGYQKWVEGQ